MIKLDYQHLKLRKYFQADFLSFFLNAQVKFGNFQKKIQFQHFEN